jgi:inorganic pyrophosphatase
MASQLPALRPFDEKKELLNVIVETPKGQRNKFKYDEQHQCFSLSKVLPAGAVFPFDFGFIPGTKAEDGDPLDALLLMEEPAFASCLVQARLIGVIEAEQTESSGETVRNDRLIAVAKVARDYEGLHTPKDIDPHLLEEYEHFFKSYHALSGGEFKVLGLGGPKRALKLVKAAVKNARNKAAEKA